MILKPREEDELQRGRCERPRLSGRTGIATATSGLAGRWQYAKERPSSRALPPATDKKSCHTRMTPDPFTALWFYKRERDCRNAKGEGSNLEQACYCKSDSSPLYLAAE